MFLNRILISQSLEAIIDKWNFMKLKSIRMGKGHHHMTKVAVFRKGKIITIYTSDKGLISKVYKELKRLNMKKRNNPIKKG